jgi:hypothetical protein
MCGVINIFLFLLGIAALIGIYTILCMLIRKETYFSYSKGQSNNYVNNILDTSYLYDSQYGIIKEDGMIIHDIFI